MTGVRTASGACIQRALQNFVAAFRGPPPSLLSLGFVKQAAATTNGELGLICPGTVEAIVAACERIGAGEVDAEFCVDVIQGGAGTSTNMNANEVIANLAPSISAWTAEDTTSFTQSTM